MVLCAAVGFGRPSGASLPDTFHSEGLQRIQHSQSSRPASASGYGASSRPGIASSRAGTATDGDRPGENFVFKRGIIYQKTRNFVLNMMNCAGFDEYKRVVNTAFEVGEHALVRDMIYVLQGIDGRYGGRCCLLRIYMPLRLIDLSMLCMYIHALAIDRSLSHCRYVKYSRRADGFIVDASAGVPRATR